MEDAHWFASGIRSLPDKSTTISVTYPSMADDTGGEHVATVLNRVKVLTHHHASTDRFFIPEFGRPFKAVAVDLWGYLNDLAATGMQCTFECTTSPAMPPCVYTCMLSWGNAMVEQVHEKRPPDVLAEDICYKMIVPAQAVRYKATDTADWTHARWPFECTFVLRDTGHGITLEVRNHMRQSLFKSFRPVGMQLTSLTQQDLLHANETWYVVHALHLAIPRSWLCRLLVGQSIAHDKGLANHRARLTPESGRPRYTENDWAYQQVHELGRKPDDVYREWLKRAGERVDTLVNPRDSFQKAIKPKK